MTREDTLEKCHFERCKVPYMVGNKVEYYRMIWDDGRRAIIFEQTPRSYPNYRYVESITFKDGKKETLDDVTGDNFPVMR